MPDLYRHRTLWNGVVTGQAVTTLYTTAIPDTAGIKAFWTALKAAIPTGVTWTVKGSGDKIDDQTGDLNGAWSTGSDLTETSSLAANAFSAPTGAILRLFTTTIGHKRRIQGRIFIVPLGIANYDNNGTLTSAFMSQLNTAGANLITSQASHLAVWSRPFAGRAASGSKPAVPARPGLTALVTGCATPDYAAVLRSRRD